MFKTKIRWCKIAESSAVLKNTIPLNKAKQYNVSGKRICVANASTGLYAVKDKCPHNGALLSHGYCTDDGFIVCPLHRYNFSLESGKGSGLYVDTYELEEREDGMYVGIPYTAFTLFGE
jgi:nitrite reductase/ring-hydroxylating ferredoxin subunit